jgi:hypothetical protein
MIRKSMHLLRQAFWQTKFLRKSYSRTTTRPTFLGLSQWRRKMRIAKMAIS